ncbi:MAG: hypothetical protein QF632_00740 [Candidatus Woesearchaeota archaeon]|jgi:hypothetical protein|nr:hypothetical protein [Candidatus Woesearchaeota archaeon]MDP7323267.1 hypothetical protein [Candidatus Woesearchaeota archaeon]MDP7457772.1 hypothetical protein [Candidatus Woesearchaeota archaeon]|tara:strand:+ start:176 stop:931 length:756 start_codon:yes stop_codon:yes gene_type:complete
MAMYIPALSDLIKVSDRTQAGDYSDAKSYTKFTILAPEWRMIPSQIRFARIPEGDGFTMMRNGSEGVITPVYGSLDVGFHSQEEEVRTGNFADDGSDTLVLGPGEYGPIPVGARHSMFFPDRVTQGATALEDSVVLICSKAPNPCFRVDDREDVESAVMISNPRKTVQQVTVYHIHSMDPFNISSSNYDFLFLARGGDNCSVKPVDGDTEKLETGEMYHLRPGQEYRAWFNKDTVLVLGKYTPDAFHGENL